MNDVRSIGRRPAQEFDVACLVRAPIDSSEEMKSIREAERVSQPVFARRPNVSGTLVSDWKRGEKKPGCPGLRMLSGIQHNGHIAVARVTPTATGKSTAMVAGYIGPMR